MIVGRVKGWVVGVQVVGGGGVQVGCRVWEKSGPERV